MRDLQALAADTNEALTAIWDDIGVAEGERASFLQTLQDDVAAIYRSRVDCEEARRRELAGEIASLQATIDNMHHAMEQASSSVVPKQDGATLTAFRDALDAERAMLQETWDARHGELKKLHAVLTSLCTDVGMLLEPSFETVGSKMSIQRISAMHAELGRVGAIKEDRTETIAGLCDTVMELWGEMAFEPVDDFEACVAKRGEGMGWSSSVIDALRSKVAALQEEKTVREDRIAVIGREITALWKRLATPEAEQTTFLESHAGIGDDVIAACETYLAAKRAEFASRLVDLIATARAAIAALWDEMKAGPAQRSAMFPDFFAPPSAFCDALYISHEEQLLAAQAQLEVMGPVLKAVEKRMALLADKAEYEHIIADPARLLAKGSSSARLREEKLERRVKKELPVVSKRLRVQLLEWEAAQGAEFIIDDARYVDRMDSEDAADAKATDDARAARAAAKDGGATSAPAPQASAGSSSSSSLSAPRSISAGSSGSAGARASIYMKPSTAGAAAMKRGVGPSVPAPHHGPAIPAHRKPSTAASAVAPGPVPAASEPLPLGGSENATSAPVAPPSAPGALPLQPSSVAANAPVGKPVALAKPGITVVASGSIAVSDSARAAAAKVMAAL